MNDRINHWLDVLTAKPLPILPHTGQKLRAQLKNSNVALADLSEIIVQDPVLTLHFLRAANEFTHRHKQIDITQTSHCLSMLGLDRIIQLARNLPVLSPEFEHPQTVSYMNAIMQSRHAASQAYQWARLRRQYQPDNIRLSALLFGVPYWAFWQFAYGEMRIIHHLVVNERVPAVEAEKSVLGCSLFSLANALAEKWKLPEVVLDAYNPKNHPSMKLMLKYGRRFRAGDTIPMPAFDEAGVALYSPAVQMLLANWLAAEADINWHSRQTQRCLGVISAHLNLDFKKCWQLIRQQALKFSREMLMPGIVSPAGRLLQPRSITQVRQLKVSVMDQTVASLLANKEAFAQDKPISLHEEKPERTADSALFQDFLSRLKRKPESFQDPQQILRDACHALHAGLGLNQVCIGLLDADRKSIQSFFSLGVEAQNPLTNFEAKLNPPNLFTQLIQKPSSLWIKPDELFKVKNLLPPVFVAITQSARQFFIMSLFAQLKPLKALGILYVDTGQSQTSLNEQQYSRFKLLGQVLNRKLAGLQLERR